MSKQERCPTGNENHCHHFGDGGKCCRCGHDSAPSSVAEQGQPKRHVCPSCKAADNNGYINAEGIRMRACDRCMIQWRDECCQPEQPSREQAVRLCKFCDQANPNWRHNRCPNCGELTDQCEMCGQSLGREQAVEGLVEEMIAILKLRLAQHVKFIQTEYDREGQSHNGYAAVLVPDWQVKQWIAHYEASRGGKQ